MLIIPTQLLVLQVMYYVFSFEICTFYIYTLYQCEQN